MRARSNIEVRANILNPQSHDRLILVVAPVGWRIDHRSSGRSVDLHAAGPAVVVAVLRVELSVVPLADVVPASENALVRAQDHLVGTWVAAAHSVVTVRVGGVEVEHKDQVAPLEHDQLIHLVLAGDERVRRVEKAKSLVQMHQSPVVRIHVLVLEFVRICKIPSPPTLVVGAAIARNELARGRVVRVVPREVDPLGMPELIAHEIEVPLTTER
mmetsp:Transcript_39286/g.84113  ORF Transcript_39286/g.84113 Transcript_39286/m.84113 type:complete len:214 (-) Transcript_39286:2224-2865(-)